MTSPAAWQRGFTLAEAVMVIAITGVIAGIVAVFIRSPVQGYFDLAARVEMTDTADTALRRIGRDLRLALPNSVRVSGNTTLEFLQTRTGGRYRAEVTGITGAQGMPLKPGEEAAATFDVLGAMPVAPQAGDRVVVFNLGIDGANAYASQNSAAIQAYDAATNRITLTAATLFPLASPGSRFQVVESPVTYRCAAGTLTRHWGYAIQAAQPDPPAGGSSAVIAENVAACAFTYAPVNERFGLLSMRLVLTRNNETVNLYHEVHVNNVP